MIAIIAILASILFPVFARARENARRSSCSSNLKQFGLSVVQYAQDYDEFTMPILLYKGTASPENSCWMRMIQPYLKSEQIMQCPSDPYTLPGAGGYWNSATAVPSYAFHSSYGFNQRLSAAATGGVALAAIVSPTTTVMATDVGTRPGYNSAGVATAGLQPHEWQEKPKSFIIDDMTNSNLVLAPSSPTGTGSGGQDHTAAPFSRHLETCNVLWADGHVKSLKLQAFYNPSTTADVGAGAGKSPCLQIATGCK